MNIFVILILLLISVNIDAKCPCKVKFAQVHPQSQSTHYSGNLEDGTLVHVTETKPTAGTITGKRITNMGKNVEPLSESDAIMYKQAIAQEAGK